MGDRSDRERRARGTAGERSPRGDALHTRRERASIAQLAARLIVEHGIPDWTLAKRKALRQLMLPEAAALPSNEEIEQALADHHALFGGEAHAASLRRQRREGLAWMQRLGQWEPLLVGGVAAGWATEHSDVRIELAADDPKVVEMALASAGIGYVASPPGEDADGRASTELRLTTGQTTLRVAIVTPQQRRNRPRHDAEPRLTARAVGALLDGE